MKSKEEIEQLAEEFTNGHYHYRGKDAFIHAYTKCQEDMVEDIRKAIQVGISAEAGDYPEGWSYKLGITLEDYYINSLNKQD